MPPSGFIPLGMRARLALGSLWAVLVVHTGVVASDILTLPLLDDIYDDDALARFDLITGLVALVEVVAVIGAAVYFIRWFNAAHRNLDALCPGVRRHPTWWSIAGWFVPIWSLFRPKQILNDMLQCAGPERLPAWWATTWWVLWLIASFAGNAVGRLSWNAETIDELRTSSIVDAVVSALFVVTAFAAMILVRRLTELLELRRAEVARRAAAAVSLEKL